MQQFFLNNTLYKKHKPLNILQDDSEVKQEAWSYPKPFLFFTLIKYT